jgi:hypothetical protein
MELPDIFLRGGYTPPTHTKEVYVCIYVLKSTQSQKRGEGKMSRARTATGNLERKKMKWNAAVDAQKPGPVNIHPIPFHTNYSKAKCAQPNIILIRPIAMTQELKPVPFTSRTPRLPLRSVLIPRVTPRRRGKTEINRRRRRRWGLVYV